jgi:hypothetical protein
MQFDSMVGYLILAFNCAIIAGYPLLALAALVSLRKRGLTGSAQAVWVLIIVAVPFLGALAYALMRPTPNPAG